MWWSKKKTKPVSAESVTQNDQISEKNNNKVAHWKDGRITHFSDNVPTFVHQGIPKHHVEQFCKQANELLKSQLLVFVNATPQLDFLWFKTILMHLKSADFNTMNLQSLSHRHHYGSIREVPYHDSNDMVSIISRFVNFVDYTCNDDMNSFNDFISQLQFKPNIPEKTVFSQSCLRSQNQYRLTHDEVTQHATARIIELSDSNIRTDFYYKYNHIFTNDELNTVTFGTYTNENNRSVTTYIHTKYFEQECFTNTINESIKGIVSFINYAAHPVPCDTFEPILKSLITNKMVIEDLMYFNYDANLQVEVSRETNGKPKFSLAIPALRNYKIYSTPSLNVGAVPRYVFDENVNRMGYLMLLFKNHN